MDNNRRVNQDVYRGARQQGSAAQSTDPTGAALYADPYGDQDIGASAEQVPGTYREAPIVPPMSVDGNHGGINQTVRMADGAAGANEISYHGSGAPTPEDMGFM